MDEFSPNDLKTILHSKRANLYYLEHCRVLVNGGRVEYITEEGSKSLYWNIPIANTTSIILGVGTSISQAAVRELAKAGVLIGFSGGGGTPLFAAQEAEIDIEWFQPQSEYRPTEYLQAWVRFYFNEEKRLQAAKQFQIARLEQIKKNWLHEKINREDGFIIDSGTLHALVATSSRSINQCKNANEILSQEALLTKKLYKLVANSVKYGDFVRCKHGAGTDFANRFLDHGNYLAYGLAATAVWVLGLPHGLAILHGKTRRGGLVFDVADLIKDALVLPHAFISAKAGEDEQEFRTRITENFHRAEALDILIDTIKATALSLGKE